MRRTLQGILITPKAFSIEICFGDIVYLMSPFFISLFYFCYGFITLFLHTSKSRTVKCSSTYNVKSQIRSDVFTPINSENLLEKLCTQTSHPIFISVNTLSWAGGDDWCSATNLGRYIYIFFSVGCVKTSIFLSFLFLSFPFYSLLFYCFLFMSFLFLFLLFVVKTLSTFLSF